MDGGGGAERSKDSEDKFPCLLLFLMRLLQLLLDAGNKVPRGPFTLFINVYFFFFPLFKYYSFFKCFFTPHHPQGDQSAWGPA